MLSIESANRRIRVLTRILNGINKYTVVTANVKSYTSNSAVSIGEIVKEIKKLNIQNMYQKNIVSHCTYHKHLRVVTCHT